MSDNIRSTLRNCIVGTSVLAAFALSYYLCFKCAKTQTDYLPSWAYIVVIVTSMVNLGSITSLHTRINNSEDVTCTMDSSYTFSVMYMIALGAVIMLIGITGVQLFNSRKLLRLKKSISDKDAELEELKQRTLDATNRAAQLKQQALKMQQQTTDKAAYDAAIKAEREAELEVAKFKEQSRKLLAQRRAAQAADGKTSTQAADGKTSTQAADGKTSTQAADGKTSTQAADGKTSTQAADGKYGPVVEDDMQVLEDTDEKKADLVTQQKQELLAAEAGHVPKRYRKRSPADQKEYEASIRSPLFTTLQNLFTQQPTGQSAGFAFSSYNQSKRRTSKRPRRRH